MLNIGIVGCGNWSTSIIKEIQNNNNFNFRSIVCRNYNSKKIRFKSNIEVYNNIDNFFSHNINDCIYVVGTPELNLKVIRLAKKNTIPVILEKPISNSYNNAKELKKITKNNKMIVLPNLTHYFSDSFSYLKYFIENNFYEIKKIIIYEGSNGPFRKKIHPIWDWGFHSFSLLIKLFSYKNFSKISSKEIKKNNLYGRGIITKFKLIIDSRFEVKVITGNLFKKKIRKIKIILNDNNVLENNMLNHKIYLNRNLVFENSSTPLQSLLYSFNRAIIEKNSKLSESLIETSCETTKVLEEFYHC